MFMTLAAVVVALVLGHLAQGLAEAVRRHGWFDDWLRWLGARMQAGSFWHGRWGSALALSAPLLVVALFQWALDTPLYGVVGLLFGIGVLFYCWGPRDLDLDVDAIVDAPDAAARNAAIARLSPDAGDTPSLVVAVFHAARRRWFGVLFWFLLLGAFGAVLYRFVAFAAEDDAALLPAENAAGAQRLLAWLDWPVSQLMALFMALVGDFDTVLSAWKQNGGAGFDANADFLGAAGRASVRSELADDAQDYADAGESANEIARDLGAMPELRDAMSLVWRTLVAWLAVIALFVIAGWVG
jgi:AmpE protein